MQFNALASIFVCHGKPKVNLPAFWQGFPAKIYYVLEYNGADQTEKIQPVRFWRHCIGTRPQVKNIIIHKTYPKLTFIFCIICIKFWCRPPLPPQVAKCQWPENSFLVASKRPNMSFLVLSESPDMSFLFVNDQI